MRAILSVDDSSLDDVNLCDDEPKHTCNTENRKSKRFLR